MLWVRLLLIISPPPRRDHTPNHNRREGGEHIDKHILNKAQDEIRMPQLPRKFIFYEFTYKRRRQRALRCLHMHLILRMLPSLELVLYIRKRKQLFLNLLNAQQLRIAAVKLRKHVPALVTFDHVFIII